MRTIEISLSAQELKKKLGVQDPVDLSELRALADEQAAKIQKLEGTPRLLGGGLTAIRAAQLTKTHNLSPQLNGVLKTFTIPAYWSVLSVHTSAAPGILNPAADYTTSKASRSITFTNEINAATVLAAGQTIIIFYVGP